MIVTPPAPTVASAFSTVAAHHPNRLAVAFQNVRLTYSEVDHRSRLVASALREHGVARGDRVLFVARNRPEHCDWLLGTMRVGAMHTAVHPEWTTDELRRAILDSQPVVVIAEQHIIRSVRAAAASTSVRWIVDLDDVTAEEAAGSGAHGADTDVRQAQAWSRRAVSSCQLVATLRSFSSNLRPWCAQ